jgi:hypothetical protein
VSRTIWKYDLPSVLSDDPMVMMPDGADVLCVQVQDGFPRVWALVDPDAARVAHRFRVYGTGHSLPNEPGRYIGTWQAAGGMFVWHLFDLGAP